ncbi:MAG: threonine/serine exporter family protein [Prevotella shahii]|uniref:threonine/serine ThrE exporter family protein n=1 Tax=Hoylesella shahii TaxID=228603 RepID=UPI001CB4888C|nr:threonine/serine exporter family protein [Hoylesella shahii]MBF1590602.1 threonine/serine exporter family protein [Hoylesella shahii]
MKKEGNQQVESRKLLRRKLDLLLRTGKILVESSADTSRIMRNMKRTAAYLGLNEAQLHIHITYNMLMVNLSDGTHSFSKFQRCDKHGIEMHAISDISKLSWSAIKEDYSLDRYEEELNKIATRKRSYTHWQVAIAAGFACGGFCIQFGCDWSAFFYASIAAALGFRLRVKLNEIGSNMYANIAVAAFVATILAWLLGTFASSNFVASLPPLLSNVLHTNTPWHPLMACTLFLVPGVPIINFVNDVLDNNIEVGIIRGINTILIVTAMAFGIVLAIRVCGIDNFVKTLSMTPHHDYWEYAVAAAISAMGFATIYNFPPKHLWILALGGIVAVCTRNYVNLGESTNNIGLDLGPVIGSLVGASLVSIIYIKVVHWVHLPHQCLSIPTVIPMVPGVLMYRCLFALLDMHGVVGELTKAMTNGMTASLIVLCVAIGVAIPNIFARKWIAPNRQRKLKRMIEERKQRGKFVDIATMGS